MVRRCLGIGLFPDMPFSELEKTGLYVHIPICRRRCVYCRFYKISSFEVTPSMHLEYARLALNEVRLFKQKTGLKYFKTIYFGGGTPSRLSLDALEVLLSGLQNELSYAREVTFEVNVEDLSYILLSLLESYGVSRLSVGVQSFSADVLLHMGRGITPSQMREQLSLLRDNWNGTWSLDLMTGFPFSTKESAYKDVEEAIRQRPNHVSLYSLIREPKTPLDTALKRKIYSEVSDSDQDDQFILAAEKLREAGYIQYETASFGRTRQDEAQHNKGYWQMKPYLGVGPSAVSQMRYSDGATVRSTVAPDFLQYCSGNVSYEFERVGKTSAKFEYCMMSLRLMQEGIDRHRFKTLFHQDILEAFPGVFERAEREGRIAITSSKVIAAGSTPLLLSSFLLELMDDVS